MYYFLFFYLTYDTSQILNITKLQLIESNAKKLYKIMQKEKTSITLICLLLNLLINNRSH
jgi:hypothetical protein